MDNQKTALLALPLFLGMGRSEMDDVKTKIRLVNSHAKKGQLIADEDEPCSSLVIVVSGTVNCITHSDDNSYYLEETLQAPLLLQPEHVFGMNQRYSSTFKAETLCEIMRIEKPMVLQLLELSMTFRMNLLNVLSTTAQRQVRRVWHPAPESIDNRIVRFIKDRCKYPAGKKALHIRMNTLARELGCARLEVSDALHRLEQRELIIVRRGIIEVPVLQLMTIS